MKTHVQNPWTRRPQLFVHLTIEEAQQLFGALSVLDASHDSMTDNQLYAIEQLRAHIQWALGQPRPQGIKGITP